MTEHEGILGRIGRLIRSNINDLVTKAEDPEKILNQVILDMQAGYSEARILVVTSMADEKRLARQLGQEVTDVDGWHRRCVLSLQAGKDHLAKEAMTQKREHEQRVTSYQAQLDRQRVSVDGLKNALHQLSDKISEATHTRDALVARQRVAKAQVALQGTLSAMPFSDHSSTFDRMADKVGRLECTAEAHGELGPMVVEADPFQELEHGVDEGLVALKRSLGMLPQESAGQPFTPDTVAQAVERGTVSA
jgi:phage shock protein A